MTKTKKAIMMLALFVLFSSFVYAACDSACSSTTQYSCSLTTTSMAKSTSGTLSVALTNKQSSSMSETATLVDKGWFTGTSVSVAGNTYQQNVPKDVSFTLTPNTAGSQEVCVNMESTGCQADCGSITITAPADVNIVSLSASSSSVSSGESVTVSGELQNAGTVTAGSTTAVSGVLSTTADCTISSATWSVGTIAGLATTSNSWTVTMGSSDCALTLTVTGDPGADPAVTETTTISVSGGGGGSGVGAAGAAGAAEAQKVTAAGITFSLGAFQSKSFKVGTIEHKLTARSVGKTYAKFAIESTPQIFTLNTSESVNVDLTNDGVADLVVKLTKIESSMASFLLKLPTKEEEKVVGIVPVPAKEAAEEEAPMEEITGEGIKELIEEKPPSTWPQIVATVVLLAAIVVLAVLLFRKKKK